MAKSQFITISNNQKDLLNRILKSTNINKNSHGFALVSVIIAFVIISLMALFFTNFISTESTLSVDKLKGSQAYYIAEGGLERALYAFNKYTNSCNSLKFTGQLMIGNYDTTGKLYAPSPFATLSNNITALSTIIPVNTINGYAPQGIIRIDSEEISYTGTSLSVSECSPFAPPCLIGIQRGFNNTVPVNHSTGTAVYQNLCSIESTGSSDNVKRTVNKLYNRTKTAVDFYDQTITTSILTTETTIGSAFNTTLPAGDNIVIAVVALRNISGVTRVINVGNLRLKKGAVVLASNYNLIRVGRTAIPGNNNFPQETYFFVYHDVGAAANPTYSVTAIASGLGISGEIKMVVINNAPNVKFGNSNNVNILNTQTTIYSLSTTPFPAGDNIVIAAVQLDNTSWGTRNINSGRLRCERVGLGTIASNYFQINLERNNRANRGASMLLIAKDKKAPANSVYRITGQASANGIVAQARVIVISGLSSAFAKTPTFVPVGNTVTTIVNLPTAFPPGENVVLTSVQYDNNAGAQRNILSGNEYIFNKGLSVSSNAFDINLCRSINTICDDFSDGLLWRKYNSTANESFSFRALANAAGINANASLLAINFPLKFSYYKEKQ